MKVLLVDDSGTMRTIQKRCLNKVGVEDVAEAEDGVQGLSMFKTAAFDLVLCDWNMPNMDGLTMLKHVREINKTVPIIMVTTEAERSRVLEAIQNGVSDYLVKPFTQDALKVKIEKWCAAPAAS
jgi:two-component system chemotaxis response regulator CheY